MKVSINDIFDQIVETKIDYGGTYALKDIRLDLRKGQEYDISDSYMEAYRYLCDCLLLDEEHNDSQKLVDLFLVHQYLCWCYLSRETIDKLAENTDQLEDSIKIIRECFFSYRVVGAFQDCTNQYEILRESRLWTRLGPPEQMPLMKEAAKSYRNTGDFRNALRVYYECLELNSPDDWLQRVELLLKMGKVYRNYLKQIEFAKFYVEEAYAILHEHCPYNSEEEKKYAFICCDTLGQIYRDEQDYERAENFFVESKETFGGMGGRACIHEMLMKYQDNHEHADSGLTRDIEFLKNVIDGLEKNPMEEVGAGIRSVQLSRLKFMDCTRTREEAFRELARGRSVAYKYNDIKTVIRSYMAEADFFKQEKNYGKYIETSKKAIELASSGNQLVLENEIIKEVVEWSNIMPDIVDSATKIGLIKRRKDIYKKLIEFSKQSIDIVRKGVSFSQDRIIAMYGIVLNDFEQISGELSGIIDIFNAEIEKINEKYTAYLKTEIQGFTYKSILHKFKNDLPDQDTIDRLRLLCENIQVNQQEGREILSEVNRRLETFANVVAHIKEAVTQTLVESRSEKQWHSLNQLIRTGIDNFVCYRPQYKQMIQYVNREQNIMIMVQSTLFETTVSEIVNNAFGYMEALRMNKEMESKFRFMLDVTAVEERTVILECYSMYWDKEAAKKAEISIREGLEHRKSTKKEGSKYGFYSMKLLFEDLMGGQIQVLHDDNKTGISIGLPIDLVTLKIRGR